MSQRVVDRLQAREFEFSISLPQALYYALERAAAHRLIRRAPPPLKDPALLNLGCGPHLFDGWINADDYAPKRRLREGKAFKPNWALDITRSWHCPNNHWDGVFSEHVLEHVSYSQAVFVLRECLRTMKPGAIIRISVPDLRRYVNYYARHCNDGSLGDFPRPAIAISFLTQMHMHRSVWDGDLLTTVLTELGFVEANVKPFRESGDPRLARDDNDKKHESVYVEAKKPSSR